MRQDVFRLYAEIVEIMENLKGLTSRLVSTLLALHLMQISLNEEERGTEH